MHAIAIYSCTIDYVVGLCTYLLLCISTNGTSLLTGTPMYINVYYEIQTLNLVYCVMLDIE